MTVKYKGLSRRTIMDIAKVIRNNVTTPSNLLAVSRGMCDYFESINPYFDRKIFMDIALAKIDGDFKTEWCSKLKEDENEP